jgi:hypothetical protein
LSSSICANGRQIYDPLSPIDASGNRTVYFANNMIPSTRFNTAGASLLGYFPQPNANVSATVNYISSQTSYPSTYPSIIGRIDRKVSEKHTLKAIISAPG